MGSLLAERVGRDWHDFEVRVFTGAVMGAMMAAMLPMLEEPSFDLLGDMDRALDFLEAGCPI